MYMVMDFYQKQNFGPLKTFCSSQYLEYKYQINQVKHVYLDNPCSATCLNVAQCHEIQKF